MVKTGLIIFGILILILTFSILEVVITPNQKNDIQTANSLCTAEVNFIGFTVPIGTWGQRVLGKEADCQKVHYFMLLINYGFIGYIFGGLLFVLGLFLGNTRKEINEIKKSFSKFCGNCGDGLFGNENHCPGCGKKIK